MNQRTMAILKAIIEEYVTSAEPVGSKTVARKYDFGVSSATIRNEMALLEHLGFIESPHTSAGRIPVEKAYRFYVNTIMDENLSNFEEEFVELSSYMEPDSFRKIIENVSREVSTYTHYASIAIIAEDGRDSIELVHVIKAGKREILCIVMMESRKTLNFMVEVSQEIPDEKLILFSKLMTEKLKGVKSFNVEETKIDFPDYKDDMAKIMKAIAAHIAEECEVDVIIEGASNLFDLPEFHDHNTARDIIRTLNEQQVLCNMFRKPGKNEITIRIGSENEIGAFKRMTTMYRTFDFNTRGMISFGVAGPLRMNYRKVLASMRDVDKLMHDMFRMI
ncbi:MAG: heat-inducible transcription repressor HrcA [Clostridia bacterium]|nr:heat-inducible transcription repressor HrcA [Clostridia bacterium]